MVCPTSSFPVEELTPSRTYLLDLMDLAKTERLPYVPNIYFEHGKAYRVKYFISTRSVASPSKTLMTD